MTTLTPPEVAALVARLQRLATVRDRAADPERRTITITEDEALALVGLVSPAALADLLRTPGAKLVLP